MSDHDLLAGVIAAELRLLPEVQHLYPPRLAPPTASVAGLLDTIADQTAVTVTGDDPLEIVASIGTTPATTALEAGRTAIAAILAALPHDARASIRLRVADIG